MKAVLKGWKGYYYLTVLCCCGMSVATIGIAVNTIGVFYTAMAESLQAGIGDIALFATMNQFFAGIFGPLLVKFCMRKNMRLVVGIGFAMMVLYY